MIKEDRLNKALPDKAPDEVIDVVEEIVVTPPATVAKVTGKVGEIGVIVHPGGTQVNGN